MTEKQQRIAKLKPFVNDPLLWEAFEDYINALIELNVRNLEQETDLLKIGRCQGTLSSLRGMLSLREQARGVK